MAPWSAASQRCRERGVRSLGRYFDGTSDSQQPHRVRPSRLIVHTGDSATNPSGKVMRRPCRLCACLPLASSTQPSGTELPDRASITVVPTAALGPTFLQIGPDWLQNLMSADELVVFFRWRRPVIWAALATAAVALQAAYLTNVGGFSSYDLRAGPAMLWWASLADAVCFRPWPRRCSGF